jgi:hypothetical protein
VIPVTIDNYVFQALVNVKGRVNLGPAAPQGETLLKGLSHEIDFKNFDKNLQNLA